MSSSSNLHRASTFDLIFSSIENISASTSTLNLNANTLNSPEKPLLHHHNFYHHNQELVPLPTPSALPSNEDQTSFHIIRNVLSMLNGLNVETVKKNPNDIFMFLKRTSGDSKSNFKLDDESCQLIIRVGGLGKILLKIINYLNYYQAVPKVGLQPGLSSSASFPAPSSSRHHRAQKDYPKNQPKPNSYPMFDDEYSDSKTLGNIKQYFVSSIHQEIKDYHYDLLMIESKFRSAQGASYQIPYQAALRRLLLWSQDWLDRFLFIQDCLKSCLDLNGVALLNSVHDQSRHGNPLISKLSRGILHQALKPFIYNMFDWLLSGEVSPEIGADFFIRIKDKEELGSVKSRDGDNHFGDDGDDDDDNDKDNNKKDFEWKIYQLGDGAQIPEFMNRLQIKKIYFIGNAVRLLRYMLKDEYDQRAVYEVFQHSQIQVNYDTMKKFVYKNVDSYGGGGSGGGASEVFEEEEDYRFFFEHPLVDDFDVLLDSYYEVINEEMFKLLNMKELRSQFEVQLGYVLMQRGDFYESLIDYLLPLLRKPASEVVNIVNGTSSTNLHRIFNMFMVNAKLIDLSQVYKIDSLLYNNYEINDSLAFSFAKVPPPMKHHLGWDIFLTRYRFTKKVYHILFDDTSIRYERLFRHLFHFKRVLYGIRTSQRKISHYLHLSKKPGSHGTEKLTRPLGQMLQMLHFLLFHMLGFISRMYQHFGSQIESSWDSVFAPEFSRKQKNIEKFIRAHARFLDTIDTIVLFNRDHSMMTAFEAVNDAILDFCESFAEMELFPTLERLLSPGGVEIDFEELQLIADQLFRHQFKISIAISKYRCCISNFIALAQCSNFEFKYDILNYQPCLDQLFACHNVKAKSVVHYGSGGNGEQS